ncbi:hypothetical protein C5167_049380 [Papaver somniferum]|uniref:Uncharacterized protein n=1 Tax=Papaver somniferum TaxID=3469 RepID=A0A4Y7KM15_PAPSO|nr:hypothetical protein C5167_049380 [Papaver somniferum]
MRTKIIISSLILPTKNRLAALLLSESQGEDEVLIWVAMNYVVDEDDYELLRDNNVGFHRPAPKEKEERRVTVREKRKGRVGCGAYIACKQEMMQPNGVLSAEKTPSSTAWHVVSIGTMFTAYYKPRK